MRLRMRRLEARVLGLELLCPLLQLLQLPLLLHVLLLLLPCRVLRLVVRRAVLAGMWW